MSEDMPDRIPENMPDRMPEDLPDRMPEDMSDKMPENMPDRMSNIMSEDIPNRMSEDLPIKKYINIMMGISRNNFILFFYTYNSKKKILKFKIISKLFLFQKYEFPI
jgi:hypothetical protein